MSDGRAPQEQSSWTAQHEGDEPSIARGERPEVSSRPPLQSHRSYTYGFGAGPRGMVLQDPELTSSPDAANVPEQPLPPTTAGEDLVALEMPVETSFGGSAPVSPVTQATPVRTEEDVEEDEEEVEEEEEEVESGEESAREMTAAERLREKRRMKRFRLNHNQTRFLMSEFARQPHPDAAQRHRLSQEIPGLSPRQVQVWFQNRRAKLKRLTTESDRESTLQSRVLPEDFDTSNILQRSLSQGYSSYGQTPTRIAPAVYPLTPELGQSNFGGSPSEPLPSPSIPTFLHQSSRPGLFSEAVGPVSPASDRAFVEAARTHISAGSPDTMHRPPSSSSSVARQRRVSQLQSDESYNRAAAEPLASPTMSFTGNLDYATLVTEPFPHELGNPMRPMSTTFAPGLDVRSPARAPFPFMLHQPPRTHVHNLSSPLSVEAGLDLTRASSIALPPTPESSAASAMVSTPGPNPAPAPAPTSLPPTLLAFSRAYDRYTFRQPLPRSEAAVAPLPDQLDPSVPFDIPTSRSALDMYASGPGGLPLDPSHLDAFSFVPPSGTPSIATASPGLSADVFPLPVQTELVPDPGMIPIYTQQTSRASRPHPAPIWPPAHVAAEAMPAVQIPTAPATTSGAVGAGTKRGREPEEPGDNGSGGSSGASRARKRRSTIADPRSIP